MSLWSRYQLSRLILLWSSSWLFSSASLALINSNCSLDTDKSLFASDFDEPTLIFNKETNQVVFNVTEENTTDDGLYYNKVGYQEILKAILAGI